MQRTPIFLKCRISTPPQAPTMGQQRRQLLPHSTKSMTLKPTPSSIMKTNQSSFLVSLPLTFSSKCYLVEPSTNLNTRINQPLFHKILLPFTRCYPPSLSTLNNPITEFVPQCHYRKITPILISSSLQIRIPRFHRPSKQCFYLSPHIPTSAHNRRCPDVRARHHPRTSGRRRLTSNIRPSISGSIIRSRAEIHEIHQCGNLYPQGFGTSFSDRN